jgi:CubicO group peptidase (beta-lactamase class C family)
MNQILRKLGIAFMLIVFVAGCAPASRKPVPPAYWPTGGWKSSTPEEQGMDSENLSQMADQIQLEKLDLRSLLIVRNGYLVDELYVYPYTAEQPNELMSVTKSVISTLVGIAIQKGYLKDVKQTLFSLLPDQGVANLDENKKAITLEDLLTMTSGLQCNENPAPGEASMWSSQDWVQFLADLPVTSQPGKNFYYCTPAVELLSAVLQKVTGMSAREFANQELFAPLGIEAVSETRWPSDPQGVSVGGYGLALTPPEMAKLGLLFLNQGQWDGKTILPASYLSAATASQSNKGDKKEYGYLFWVDPQGKWYAALGRSGKHIFVYPAQNLVVTFTADLPASKDGDLAPLQELLDQYILPAVKSNKPLPANPESQARLQAGIKALAQPQKTAPPPLPAIASDVSGKTYTFGDNPFGWHSLSFNFQDGGDEAIITIDATQQGRIGLDNVYRWAGVGETEFPQGFRGSWADQNTFVVEQIQLGQPGQLTFRVQFSGNDIHITEQEKYSEGKVEVQGTQSPATE